MKVTNLYLVECKWTMVSKAGGNKGHLNMYDVSNLTKLGHMVTLDINYLGSLTILMTLHYMYP